MDAVLENVCGLDVHKEVIVACVLIGSGRPKKETRTFEAFRDGLVQMRDWLRGLGCRYVGMESTGSYWLPVYEVLEETGGIELVVCNAQHVKKVPGRKTDVGDAEWLARLLRAGLLCASFVPPVEIRELRDLLRSRRGLVCAQTDERNRISKLMQTAQIRIDSVATDLFGASGMAMLGAITKGETDPATLSEMARGKLRRKLESLARALGGRIRDHHRFLLGLHLEALDGIAQRLATLDARIEQKLEPYRAQMARLQTVPGIAWLAAAIIVAETGARMEVFGSAERLAAWAGVAPGNNESAGKALGGRGAKARKGNEHLTTVLFEVALAAGKKKGSVFKAKYHSLLQRLGSKKKAIMAIAHKVLRVVFRLLAADVDYREIGETRRTAVQNKRAASRLLERINILGFALPLEVLLAHQVSAPQRP